MWGRRDTLKTDVIGWMRDVAVTALVVTLGFITFATVTGRAYASLPGIDPPSRSAVTAAGRETTSPHGPEPACAACHRSHTGVASSLLSQDSSDSSVCTQCHKAAGAEEKSAHSNIDYAGATQPAFYVSCAQCHDPHGDPNAGGNKAMIRSSIAGLPVSLLASSGPGSFDDGMDDGQHNSICVVCHSTTAHNNVNSPELMGQGHGPVGSDCTSCHQHGDSAGARSGFMPAGSTSTPTPASTDTPAPTATDTPTPLPGDTSTPAPLPTDTATPVPLPTDTPAPPPTDTPLPVPDSPTPSTTPTETPTPGG
jgi:predicted CXXCH cytochrome family protein